MKCFQRCSPDCLLLQASDAHVLQIAAIVNEKFRERVPAWDVSGFDMIWISILIDFCQYLCEEHCIFFEYILSMFYGDYWHKCNYQLFGVSLEFLAVLNTTA